MIVRNRDKFTQKQYKQIRHWKNKVKKISLYKKLEVLYFASKGYTNLETSQLTCYTLRRVSWLINEYLKNGIDYFLEEQRKGGNRRILTDKQEEDILEKFREKAINGKIVNLKEIKVEYDRVRGIESANSTFYDFLHRNEWRKVMPRGAHPKKASEEAIEASKKLTHG